MGVIKHQFQRNIRDLQTEQVFVGRRNGQSDLSTDAHRRHARRKRHRHESFLQTFHPLPVARLPHAPLLYGHLLHRG